MIQGTEFVHIKEISDRERDAWIHFSECWWIPDTLVFPQTFRFEAAAGNMAEAVAENNSSGEWKLAKYTAAKGKPWFESLFCLNDADSDTCDTSELGEYSDATADSVSDESLERRLLSQMPSNLNHASQ